MNKIEALKNKKNGLEIIKDIKKFAEEGWESISEDDVQRLKWYGLFLRKPTPGFFMLRVRIPNGKAFSHQVKVLSRIADFYGNGSLDITTRQQIQVRHLKIENILEIFEFLNEVGLTSMQTGMDNVRNIMGCPISGINPKETMDASWLVRALSDEIVGNEKFSNLPRKFNMAVSCCPENCIHSETQDLAFVPSIKKEGDRELSGFNVLAGGKLGSGGYRIASSLDMFVLPEEVVETSLAILSIYRDHGSRENRKQNRLGHLIDEWGVEKFRKALSEYVGRSFSHEGKDLRELQRSEHIGIYRQKQTLMNYVGLKVIVGRIEAKKLQEIAELSEKYGNGEIRFTPAQSLIIPNVSDKKLGDFLDEPLLKEFVYHPSGVMKNLVSCVGSDYCHLSTIETKTRARETAIALERKLGSATPISMHWSGCPAGCGNHLVADIGFLGKRVRIGKDIVEAVDVFMGGRAGPHPKQAVKILENVPCSILVDLLAQVIPYHTREKMHPVKGQKAAQRKKELQSQANEKGLQPLPNCA